MEVLPGCGGPYRVWGWYPGNCYGFQVQKVVLEGETPANTQKQYCHAEQSLYMAT